MSTTTGAAPRAPASRPLDGRTAGWSRLPWDLRRPRLLGAIAAAACASLLLPAAGAHTPPRGGTNSSAGDPVTAPVPGLGRGQSPSSSPGPGASPPEKADRPTRKRGRSGKPPVVGVLNVNRASAAELRLLPGIGKGRAALIVERRDKHPFASVDEIARLRGMRKLVQRLRGNLAVSGDSTLRPAPPAARPAP